MTWMGSAKRGTRTGGATFARRVTMSLIQEGEVCTLGIVEGMGRTSNVAEGFFRRYKQRVARMGCFMSDGGCGNSNAVWEMYINFEPYQVRKERKKHYRYPGLCPLEVGEAQIQGVTWLEAVGI